MREQRDRFDEALDMALTRYGEAPEREGLERRVLERVTKRMVPTSPIRSFAVSICTTAAAICCLLWWQTPKASVRTYPARTSMPAVRKVETSKRQVPARDYAIVPASATKRRPTLKRSGEPKLSQFPTPFPMSSEERALLQLTTRDAKDIPRELTAFGGPIEPIQITPIEIKPL